MKFKFSNPKPIATMWQVLSYLSVAIGVCIFVYGFWLFWKPGAYIVGGVLLTGTGFFSALDDKTDDHEDWD